MLSLSLVGTIALQPVLSQVSLGVSDVATEGAQGTDVSASQRVNSADGITNVTDEFGRTLSDRANALMAGGEYAQYASSHESRKVIVELDGKSLSEDFLSLGAVSAYKSLSDYALSAAGK